MLTVAAGGFGGIAWLGDGEERATGQVLGSVRLLDNDGDAAMFTNTVLTPGVGVSRCIEIGYAGASGPGSVHLAAESVRGALVDALDVTVERGPPGAPARCAGFSGTRVFSGPLRALTARRAGHSGVATGWRPGDGGGDVQSFRITVVLNVRARPAAGAGAQADFVWRLQPATTLPAPAGAGTSSPTLPAPVVTASSAEPGGQDIAAAPSTAAQPSLVRRLLRALTLLAKEIGEHAAIPIAVIVVMVVFLLVQGAADRRDPKLALAPVTRGRYVWIPRTPGEDK